MSCWNGSHPKGGKGVLLMKAQPWHCRWPLGSMLKVSTRFCGEDVSNLGRKYCDHHYARAYTGASRQAKT